MGNFDIDLTNRKIEIAINPEYGNDVMFCVGYESGIPCCDFGEDLNGKHAIGIGNNDVRQCALITLEMLDIIAWSDEYFTIINSTRWADDDTNT